MATPYVKPALTFEQQLATLEGRGVIVSDREKALSALSRISYYRLSAYFYPFRTGDTTFEPGTRFDAALALYEFDRRLRLAVLDAIERVEVLARTRTTYDLSHARGAFAHHDPANFDDRFGHTGWLEGYLEELHRAKEKFLEHFRAKYEGYPRVPIWMASEVMSLGRLSRLYEGLRSEQQTSVAQAFGVHRRVAVSWLHSLSYVRNVCAHHARLWNRELAIKPALPSGQPELWAPVNAHRVFGVLCILRFLTRPCHGGDAWAASVRALLREMDDHPRWLKAMGTPVGWATHSLWR